MATKQPKMDERGRQEDRQTERDGEMERKTHSLACLSPAVCQLNCRVENKQIT